MDVPFFPTQAIGIGDVWILLFLFNVSAGNNSPLPSIPSAPKSGGAHGGIGWYRVASLVFDPSDVGMAQDLLRESGKDITRPVGEGP